MRAAGNGSMPAEEVLAVLGYHCGLPHELIPIGIAQPPWMRDPLFSQYGQLESDSLVNQGAAAKRQAGNTARIAAATSMAEAEEVILDVLLDKLVQVLSVDRLNLNTSKPLYAYGVDSLVAVDASINHLAKMATVQNRFLPVFTEPQRDEAPKF
ncbi:hypothetical protein EKO27_g2730 [Xylaria grammica]|uniref:Carrier domain-containing protein n=1 Tax=Xylaria grammica TaxID=363999 RepID=A0A439DD53_9PEZI|nr:hypothetical protein EKO27_g2730 [Xylaria grammica]